MKKRNLLYAGLILAIVIALSSCFHDHGINITVNDDDDVYRFRASYDRDMTDEVNRIINKHLHGQHSTAFVHTFTEKEIRLDDGTNFYIRSGPGRLRIRLDRDDNSEENCEEIRAMCDEIKDLLAGGDHE